MMVPGNFKVDIDSTFGNAQKCSGEFLADYNKPNSLVLVVDHYSDLLSNDYDYVVDLSHKIKELDQYDKTDFTIKFNKDGSIQYLFEENPIPAPKSESFFTPKLVVIIIKVFLKLILRPRESVA